MGQLENLRLFSKVVDYGSISEAARHLDVAKSAISRQLAQLEDRYETRLIDRGPGLWAVTESGKELYQRATTLIGELDEIEADYTSVGASLSGPLSVSAPRDFGLIFLSRAIINFKYKYSAIDLSVDFDDRVVDLERENYDFAIRITGASTQSLLRSSIGRMSHRLYASKDYVMKHGEPQNIDDLPNHRLLSYGAARRASWHFTTEEGQKRRLSFRPFLRSNSGKFLLDAAINGMGIALLPKFLIPKQSATPKLVPLLPSVETADWDICLLYSENRRLNRRMKVFLDEMRIACQQSHY